MRWISDERAWGCDRCKRLYPVPRDYPTGGRSGASGVGMPMQPRRSPWLFVIGALVVIAAGFATGLAVTYSGDEDGDGGEAEAPKDTSAGPTLPKTPPPPAPLTCESVFAHAMRISRAKLTKDGFDESTMGKMELAGVKRCREDGWSDEVLKCIDATTQQPKLAACRAKLGEEKEAKLAKALEVAAGAKAGFGSDGPVPASVASGSGSSGSGSSGSGSSGSGSSGSGSSSSSSGSAVAKLDKPAKTEKPPTECVEYSEALLALSKCRRLPHTSRDALKQAYDATVKELEGLGTLTAAARRDLVEKCKKDMGSIKKSRAVCAARAAPSGDSF